MEYAMQKKIIILIFSSLILTGCASSSELNKRAENNAKAGEYYESIGQPEAAKRSREMAQENNEDSLTIEAILFNLFFGSDDK
jgi:PBP1b-binding outer membrane lipoprotein LpoB